ncbi:MAG: hypothetical protein M1335_08015, partial [Chloroflexi bacterium]|nr:hypothetical protein [Chloroflexota bacterium]
MKILLLTQIVPYPPDSGPRVKTYHVIRHLAECGHRVALVTFVRAQEEQNIEHLKPYCAEIHTVPIHRSRVADVQALAVSFRTGIPFLVACDARTEMFNTVRELIEHQPFDIVQADQPTMAQYALEYQKAEGGRHPANPAGSPLRSEKAEGGGQKADLAAASAGPSPSSPNTISRDKRLFVTALS